VVYLHSWSYSSVCSLRRASLLRSRGLLLLNACPAASARRCVNARFLRTTSASFKYALPAIPADDEKFIVRSPYSDVVIPEDLSLADYVWKDVDNWPDNIALICGMTGRQYTYEMAHNMSKKFGSALLRMGAKRGDVLGMVVPNIPEFPIAFMGAAGVGVTLTTMNPTYRPEEIARQLENSNCKYILTIGLFLSNIRQACEIYGGIEKIIVLGMEEKPDDCHSFIEMLITDDGSLYGSNKDTFDAVEDTVVLPYSSGTTGPPKGVSLTHYNIIANMAQLSHSGINVIKPPVDGVQDTTVAVLPFFHIYAMNTIMTLGLQMGTKIVTLPKFEPAEYLKTLATYKPTFLNLVPPLVSFLSTNPAVKAQHMASVRTVSGGASVFGPALIEKFLQRFPKVESFREGFGMTESSPVTHVQPENGARLGGCGHPIPNTIAKIVDLETGQALPADMDGELMVAGPQVMKGYYGNKKATNATIKDGWLLTGDIAKYDETGQFVIVDRLKELIKVKGLQVAPSELEDLIRRHPGVDDVAVVGVPDDRAGELPRAYVVRKNRNVLEQSIIDWVAEKVAPHKKLGAGVMFVETLPKNQTGKVLRRELKAQVFKGSFGY
jgi:4-coumarate--CoA ligase